MMGLTRALAIFLAISALAGPARPESVRLCAGAGKLFPETEAGLRATVTKLLEEADAPAPEGPLYACVVPHGPYGISGKVMAQAFKHLKPGQFKRVIVLGASHAQMDFEDCSLPAVDAFATPLGFVPLDAVAMRKLAYSPLFATRSLRYPHLQRAIVSENEREPLHEYEHSIEIVLPFLQERLGEFELVPVLLGRLSNPIAEYNSERVEERAAAIALHIKRLMDSETLLVVSTDFTHYGNDFAYRPFDGDILGEIEKLDRAGLSRLAANDYAEFDAYHRRSEEVPICGLTAIRVLLKILPRNAYGTLLGHNLSGRFYNDETRSVSYASMNFYLSDTPRPRETLAPLNAIFQRELPEFESDDADGAGVTKAAITLTNIPKRGAKAE